MDPRIYHTGRRLALTLREMCRPYVVWIRRDGSTCLRPLGVEKRRREWFRWQ